MKVQNGKTYIGVVEDNNDPKKIGRVKVRVLDVFDNTPLEDIPWANPWKDLTGDNFRVPDKGKVVTVVFESANINNPEFIFSEHYNINLEKKLSELSEENYTSMKSLIFDHKTQIYVNDEEGLKLDHKFNMINIKENSIDVNLKDNNRKINLGSANSDQRVILGDNFLNWFDSFIQILMGGNGGAFLGNLGAPVLPTPALLGSLQLYQQLKDPKFLSRNVYAVDNENVTKLDRISEGQKGDTWQSTVIENTVTSTEEVKFKPVDTGNSTIDIVKELLKGKKYTLYEDKYRLNLMSVRLQCLSPGDKYTNMFVDRLYIFFKQDDDSWMLKQYMISTVPGLEFTVTEDWLVKMGLKENDKLNTLVGKKIFMKEYAKLSDDFKSGLPILTPSQYVDAYYLSDDNNITTFLNIKGSNQLIWRDNGSNYDIFEPSNLNTIDSISSDIGLRLYSSDGGVSVGYSEGDQLLANKENLTEIVKLCEKHIELYGNKFTYTLVTKNDWDEASKVVETNRSMGVTAEKNV